MSKSKRKKNNTKLLLLEIMNAIQDVYGKNNEEILVTLSYKKGEFSYKSITVVR